MGLTFKGHITNQTAVADAIWTRIPVYGQNMILPKYIYGFNKIVSLHQIDWQNLSLYHFCRILEAFGGKRVLPTSKNISIWGISSIKHASIQGLVSRMNGLHHIDFFIMVPIFKMAPKLKTTSGFIAEKTTLDLRYCLHKGYGNRIGGALVWFL